MWYHMGVAARLYKSQFAEVYEMKDFSKATKIGMIIMIIAGIVMAILVVASEPVPDLIAWIFFAGLAISIVPALSARSR